MTVAGFGALVDSKSSFIFYSIDKNVNIEHLR